MCITSAAAKLSKTRILSCPLGEKHLLAYANSAVNLADMPNSMILAVPGTLTQADFIDTTPYAKFLEELENAWTPRSRSLSMSKGISAPVQQFKVGMYEVFLAPGGKSTIVEKIKGQHRITEALKRLPEEQRPGIRSDLLEWFDSTYPGWSIVVCVFENSKPMDAQPIMFTYTPFPEWQNRLFFPGVDSHTGGPPDLDETVDVDHFLFTENPDGWAHNFATSHVPDFLKAKKFIGVQMNFEDKNGDWVHKYEPIDRTSGPIPRASRALFTRTRP